MIERKYGIAAEGNITIDDEASYTVDAAGRLIKTSQFDPDSGLPMAPTRDWFDGNGRLAKRVKNFGSTDPAPQTNYYLRSSVTGAVLSETEQTGRKLKTFVPANGTTLAEQELVTIGSTTTEKLTFIHQDPSLASLQRTDNAGNLVNSNARAGEYDALGRNVADAGPYVTLNTDPPVGDSGGSGINLDGTAQGYRPGRINYFADGLPVPEDYARDLINSGRMGGIFGVVEAAVRISNRDGQWIDSDGPCTVSPGNDFCVGTATRYFQLDSSWGASNLMGGLSRRTGPLGPETPRRLTTAELAKIASDMKLILDSSEKCRNLISVVLNAAEREDNPIVSTNLVDVFWAVALQSDGVFERQFSDRGAQTMGDIFSRTAVIELGVRNLNLPFKDVTKGARARYKRDQELLRALDAIAESIHQAGALLYDDRDLAEALAEVKGIKTPQYGWNTQQDVLNWSMWFHSNFERDCNTQSVKR